MGRAGSSARDRKVQPPRPPNSWILYRSYQSQQIRANNDEHLPQSAVSKLISAMWKEESAEVKSHYAREAEKRKAEHQEANPGYHYRPQRKVKKLGKAKSKCRNGTPSSDQGVDDNDAPPAPAFPLGMNIEQLQPHPQPFLIPAFPHNMTMPQPFIIPYHPEAYYGPGGPSPPISAAPSPAQDHGSPSPVESPSAENVPSSSSSPSTQLSSSFQHQSPSPSQLLANSTHLPSLPDHHQSSHFVTQPLSTLLFPNSTLPDLPLISPRLQLQVTENTVTPAALGWNGVSAHVSTRCAQDPEEIIELNVAINQTPNPAELRPALSLNLPFDGTLSATDENTVFEFPGVESSTVLNPPNGDLQISMGPAVDYSDEYFAEFVFDDFSRQVNEEGSSSTSATPALEDLQSLFRVPNSSGFEAYAAARQRQPGIFTQEMMDFLNFEAVDNSSESQVPASAPLSVDPTFVASQQVRHSSSQVAAAMPIFTPMTNTPTVAPEIPYVPPAGVVYPSTRRVADSWKPSFAAPYLGVDDPVPSWTL